MSPAVEQGWRWFKNVVYFVAIAAGVKLFFGTYFNGVSQIPVAFFGFIGGVIFFGMPAFVLGWLFANAEKVGAVVRSSINSTDRVGYSRLGISGVQTETKLTDAKRGSTGQSDGSGVTESDGTYQVTPPVSASNPRNDNSAFVGIGVFFAVLFAVLIYGEQNSTEETSTQQWAPPSTPPIPEGAVRIGPEDEKASPPATEKWAPPNAPPLPEGFTWVKPGSDGATVSEDIILDNARVSDAAILLIRTDTDCSLSVNGKALSRLLSGQVFSVRVNPGDQLIECTSVYVRAAVQTKVDRGAQRVVQLRHSSREIEERNAKARERYLNNTPEW